MTYIDQCIKTVDDVNRHLENARVAYNQRLFRRCTAQITKASDKIYDIISHPERIDDDIDDVVRLAKAFSKLSIPFPTSTGITHCTGVLCYPDSETFASLYFYILNVGRYFVEHAQAAQRISGKKQAYYAYP